MATPKKGDAMKKALAILSATELKTLSELTTKALETTGGGSSDFWHPEKAGEVLAGKITRRLDGLKSKRYKSRPPYSILIIQTSKGEIALACQGYKLAEMIEKENPQAKQLIAVVFKGTVKTKGGTMKNYDYAMK